MSLHKLSAGGGVTYLLRHTCCGDVQRAAQMPLSAYYTADGYPPGRWLGAGLDGLNRGAGLDGLVDEVGMERLFGLGLDPVTEDPLGKNWPVHKTATQRIAARIVTLPADLPKADRVAAIARDRGGGEPAADPDRGVRVRPDTDGAEVGQHLVGTG